MTIMLSSLKADLAREIKGDWIDFPDWPGVAFNVSSLHKPEYVTARDLLMQKLAKQYKNQSIPRDALMVALGKLYYEHILHGWRGLDEDYSPELAKEVMGSAEYRNVIAAVEWCAAKVSEDNIEFVADEVGN